MPPDHIRIVISASKNTAAAPTKTPTHNATTGKKRSLTKVARFTTSTIAPTSNAIDVAKISISSINKTPLYIYRKNNHGNDKCAYDRPTDTPYSCFILL